MDTFSWRKLQRIDPEDIRATKMLMHQAIQNVAAVGRKFLPASIQDENATLTWIPGLSRMAGKWVTGDVTFRSSIHLESFKIFLVDQKVKTLASFDLQEQSNRELMLWLEEQIGKLGLRAANLTLNLPYTLPFPVLLPQSFKLDNPRAAVELAKLYHNAYVQLKRVKSQFQSQNNITIWPHKFDQSLEILIKDTGDRETNTTLLFGMSPGDAQFESPYFFVSSWPNADTSKCEKLSNNGFWVSDEWTGAVLPLKHIFEGDQQQTVGQFYEQAGSQLIKLLTQ